MLLTSVAKQCMTLYFEMQNLAKKRVTICRLKLLGFNIYELGQSLQHIQSHSCWCCKFMELEKISGFPGIPWDYLFENQLARSIFFVLKMNSVLNFLCVFKTKKWKAVQSTKALQRVLRSLINQDWLPRVLQKARVLVPYGVPCWQWWVTSLYVPWKRKREK